MILKLRSIYFPLKPESHIWIWLLLVTSISPSTCAFDILLNNRELSSGPAKFSANAAAKNWEPFSLSRRSETAEPRRRQLDAKTKFLRHLAKVLPNDVHVSTNDNSPNMLADVPNMDSLIRDLAKWKQTRQIVKELRRRNNMPTLEKSWKKTQARHINRNLRKQDPLRSYRAAPISQDPFRDTLDKPQESGDEVLVGSFSPGLNLEPMGLALTLDGAAGFEDFALTPVRQNPVAREFSQFTDDIDASEKSRNVRQDGFSDDGGFDDGGFSETSSGCTNILGRVCNYDSDCNCYGFYSCQSGQCQLLSSGSQSSSNGNSQASGQWHNGPASCVK